MDLSGHSFCKEIFKRNINRYSDFLCLNFPPLKFSYFAVIFYQLQPLCSYKVCAYKKGIISLVIIALHGFL